MNKNTKKLKERFRQLINQISWPLTMVACLTLGLAPHSSPHIVEKLNLLLSGSLTNPIDIFDFFMHGCPWLILFFKLLFLKKT